jgi:hypothetical protein
MELDDSETWDAAQGDSPVAEHDIAPHRTAPPSKLADGDDDTDTRVCRRLQKRLSSQISQVFLCISVQGKKVAAAYYKVDSSELMLIPEVTLEFDEAMVEYVMRMKLQIQPSTIITSTQTADNLVNSMREPIGLHSQSIMHHSIISLRLIRR